jgi:hypothetical protein
MVDRYRPRLASTLQAHSKAGTEAPKKVRGRPFPPGNPGRPRGSKNRTTRLLEQLLDGQAEKVTEKFVELALAGNVKCIELCMDRLLPRRNGRPVDFTLPTVNNINDVVTAMAAITSGVNDGSLTAEEAGQLVNFLNGYAKILDVHNLATRLETLEQRMEKNHEA